MRKFTVIHRKGATAIQEVECTEEFCHSWEVRSGEKKYRITAPEEIKDQVWMDWAFVDTEGEALVRANLELRGEYERSAIKSHTKFDEQAFLAAVTAIKVAKL